MSLRRTPGTQAKTGPGPYRPAAVTNQWLPTRGARNNPAAVRPHTLEAISLILIPVFLAWFWLDSLRAREIATGICRAACDQRQVQLLDQTVALRHLGVRWPPQGLRFRRVYRFDFSEEGIGRHTGHLIMLGQNLEEISLGLPSDPTG